VRGWDWSRGTQRHFHLIPKSHMQKTLRSLVLAAAAIVLPTALSAQASATSFGKGTKILSLGLMTGGDYDGFGGGASVEVGVVDFTPKIKLGVGGLIGYVRNSESFGLSNYTFTAIPVMAIGNVHFEVPNQPKLDLYAGASVGIIRGSFSGSFTGIPGGGASNTDTGFGIQGGARYGIGDKLSVMGQIGIGDIPLLFAGVSLKF